MHELCKCSIYSYILTSGSRGQSTMADVSIKHAYPVLLVCMQSVTTILGV